MKKISRFLTYVALILLVVFPTAASAHATPVFYEPEASVILDSAPASVSIRFSEHLEEGASSLTVTGPSGKTVSTGAPKTDPEDSRTLSVPIINDGAGAYLASWSVVSSDDGHFTKGAYSFGVGSEITLTSESSDFEVVETSNIPEAFAMAIELTGHGIIWAVLLLFIFAARPLLRSGSFPEEARLIRKGYSWLLFGSIAFVVVGALAQLGIKAENLASLRGNGFWEALQVYAGTAAGSSTLWRICSILVAGIVFFFGRSRIFASKHATLYEWAMLLSMCAFAFFRAKISHAAANPFYPDFSIAVNFFHLIDKDIWAGIILVLFLMTFSKRMQGFLAEFLPKAFTVLSVVLASISVTATYIVWLHLKSFSNLFTTTWGLVFLELLIASVLMVAFRAYHVVAQHIAPHAFQRFLSATLAAELALSVLVIFYSSVVIITSPPLYVSPPHIFAEHNQGVEISFIPQSAEDGVGLLVINGKDAQVPVVTLSNGSSGEIVSLDVSKRFDDGYGIPLALFGGEGSYRLSINVPQEGRYDARASFTIAKSDLAPSSEDSRSFDPFTITMIGIGVVAFMFALLVGKFSSVKIAEPARPFMPGILAPVVFLIVAFAVGNGISALATSGYLSPYKARCEADGNMWHLMLPMKAGKAISETPREGCMWGIGDFMYMFPDEREYSYYQELPQAEVSLTTAPKTLIAGVPADLTVSLKNADGTPATLFVDMEKLVHMVVVSEDETVFAHIHADDTRPLTREEIANSEFTFNYTFPKAGKYLISADYAHGLTLESKQFTVEVSGGPQQAKVPATFESNGRFDGYDVSLKYDLPFAGEVNTLRFILSKDGEPVTNAQSYLSAAAHISIVKNDLSAFIHTHGEVHKPGTPYPSIIVKNGQVVHSMSSMTLPAAFGPNVEAHLIFPSKGIYTVWVEFKIDGKVIPTSFTVKVEK